MWVALPKQMHVVYKSFANTSNVAKYNWDICISHKFENMLRRTSSCYDQIESLVCKDFVMLKVIVGL